MCVVCRHINLAATYLRRIIDSETAQSVESVLGMWRTTQDSNDNRDFGLVELPNRQKTVVFHEEGVYHSNPGWSCGSSRRMHQPQMPTLGEDSFQAMFRHTATKVNNSSSVLLGLFTSLLLSSLEKGTLRERTTSVVNLYHVSIGSKFSRTTQSDVLFARVLGESPLQTLQDLLTSSELELSTTNSLNHVWLVGVLGSHRNQDLTNADASGNTNWFSVRVTHTGGETISSGARKHFIGSQNHKWVGLNTDVVVILSNVLDQMLIDGNTASFESLGRNLLFLITHQVGNEREEIDGSLLGTDIEDTNL